ncbi:hypothetical protein [Altibacter sp. HG106]|uniref:hypothetical protein n=1 Tax=Altibacter sp. HG106 TaxID=3023937 RepID=UPI00235050C1|nr:hypothetical protein [Altibacter sp. HG106]MDC7996332.1 hypothetical protein [Altibacter sp. HG106]
MFESEFLKYQTSDSINFDSTSDNSILIIFAPIEKEKICGPKTFGRVQPYEVWTLKSKIEKHNKSNQKENVSSFTMTYRFDTDSDELTINLFDFYRSYTDKNLAKLSDTIYNQKEPSHLNYIIWSKQNGLIEFELDEIKYKRSYAP